MNGGAFALSGRLISGEQLRSELHNALVNAKGTISIASAFLKAPALNWAAERIGSECSVRILARWQLRDLLEGSSDLSCFEIARAKGWPLFILNDFHGKVYQIEDQAIFVGSANLTSRGLSLFGSGNDEVNVRAEQSKENSAFVEDIFRRGILVDDALFGPLKAWVETNRASSDALTPVEKAPASLLRLLLPTTPPEKLFVDECFQALGSVALSALSQSTSVAEPTLVHDLSLLAIDIGSQSAVSRTLLQAKLRNSKMVRWLIEQLKHAEGQSLYFGAVTAALHGCLLDDPAPYRTEVKQLAANLLSWIDAAALPEIRIDKPNYSQRISLLTS